MYISLSNFNVTTINATANSSSWEIEILINDNTSIHEITSKPNLGQIKSQIALTLFANLDEISEEDSISKLLIIAKYYYQYKTDTCSFELYITYL